MGSEYSASNERGPNGWQAISQYEIPSIVKVVEYYLTIFSTFLLELPLRRRENLLDKIHLDISFNRNCPDTASLRVIFMLRRCEILTTITLQCLLQPCK